MSRVLVCGGRAYANWNAIERELSALKPSVVICGGCRGADKLAARWAEYAGIRVSIFPADWSKGRAAGPIRNQQMLDEGKPDLVLAFPGGRGTADMVRRAHHAGIAVRMVP